MTGIPILNSANSLEHFKTLLPLSYQWRDVGDGEFLEYALTKAQSFDSNFSLADLQSILGISDSAAPPSTSAAATVTVPHWVVSMNQDFAWIEADGSIFRLRYGDFIDPAKFKTQFDNQTVSVQSGGNAKQIGMGTAWLKNRNRREHRRLVMRPREGLVTTDNCLNEWQGFAVKPVSATVAPFLNLLDRLVPDPKARFFVQAWLAHLIQHPEVKMHVSLAFWSLEQGVGKNLLFETVSAMIGATHATVIGQTELTGDFNGWANRRVFVIGDEVSSSDRRQDADKLKGLITSTTVRINEKYQPAREVPNLMNFIFLSNHNDALFLDDHDRRFFVWEIIAARLPDQMAQTFVAWRNNGGLASLLHFLQTYDVKDFNPKAHAPMTAAKQQMVQDNRSDLETWLSDLMASNVAAVLGREIVTGHEIARRYDHDTDRRNTSAKAVTSTCKKLGAYARPHQVHIAGGKKVRAMAIARADYWKAQSEVAWTAELDKRLAF